MVETIPVCAFCHYAMRDDNGVLRCDFCDGPRCNVCIEPLCPAGTCTNKQCPRHGYAPPAHNERTIIQQESND